MGRSIKAKKLLNSLKNKVLEEEKPEILLEKPQTVEECAVFIGKVTTDSARWPEEKLATISELQDRACSGEPESIEKLLAFIKELLEQFDICLDGMSAEWLAYEIFKKNWGLDVIHDLFYDPEVIEVYVDRPDNISVSRMGKIEKVPGFKFRNEQHVINFILRMIKHDQDAHFDDSHPYVQCVREDDSRLTAFRPPLVEHTCFALRKLNAVNLTSDYLIKTGTVNEQLWDTLVLLARYGARILFIGPPESGKTSWLRLLTGELEKTVRSVSIEIDRELRLQRYYPDRSIVEMEEHAQLKGGSLKHLFAGFLRLSAVHLIFGEFRLEEIDAAVMAGERARYFWSTSHFRTAKEAVAGMADLLLSNNPSLSHEVAEKQVLRAFDTFVTVYGDFKRGIKKILDVTVVTGSGHEIEYHNLVRWQGGKNDYWDGGWTYPKKPPREFIDRMYLYGVTETELKKVGWL